MTRERMLDELSACEVEEARALEQIEPWGERAMNLRFAVLFTLLVGMVSDKNKCKIEDWLKYFEPGHEPRQDPVKIKAAMRSMGGIG